MKRFITAMLFSLTVIVYEQQTLFAPHYKDYSGLTAANPGDTTNSLVPVAGVNMSMPLAGSSDNGFQRYPPLVKPKHDSPSFVTSNVDLASTPDDGVIVMVLDDMSFRELEDYTGDQDPGAGIWIDDCPPYEPCDDPAFHNVGGFLPWHRW